MFDIRQHGKRCALSIAGVWVVRASRAVCLLIALWATACSSGQVQARDAGTSAAVQRGAPAESPRREATAARRDLEADERRGGHTLERHVGRTDDQLRARLRQESVSAASTYTDKSTAERVVGAAIARSTTTLDRWLARPAPRPNLTLDYHGDRHDPIGRSIGRNARGAVPCFDALVVLRSAGRAGYYVLTSYPEVSR